MRRTRPLMLLSLLLAAAACSPSAPDYAITPVPFSAVQVEDAFWGPRLETNREVTIPYDFQRCEETGRIANFARAGGLEEGDFEGIYYNDSDVYKVIEGAAYALALEPDAELEAYVDGVIAKIAAAQQEDGYLLTYYILEGLEERWTNLKDMHELYCAGHLFEAAAAHYQATGKRTLLDVAIRLADHIDSIFGPQGRHGVPGHEEIEIGLSRLYRVTGEERYLDLAEFFLDNRGRPTGRELYGTYAQDHKPVTEQTEPVGHAVRAGYLYSGMADVAALKGREDYIRALDAVWESTVHRKMYLTGGIGSRRSGEAFGEDYELPNESAYNETCAAVANAMWNHRMFLVHGEGKYIDVLERVIYNGFLSGVSLSGDRFFYPNPLLSTGKDPFRPEQDLERQPWFRTSCCPVNVARFVPSIAGYIYARRDQTLYVNLFVGGEAEIGLEGLPVTVRQTTRYPWQGEVRITVDPERAADFEVAVRIPGWARGEPVPGELYRYAGEEAGTVRLTVAGEPVEFEVEQGYARIRRRWEPGDEIRLELPMPVRRVLAHPEVAADRDRVALERGPVVYCVEGADHGGRALDLAVEARSRLEPEWRGELLGGVTVLVGEGRRVDGGGPVRLTAVPYHVWNHRGPGEMTVWLHWLPGGGDTGGPRP